MSNAIAVAFERDDVRMVQKPIQHRGGCRRFVEEIPLIAKVQVTGDDQRALLVSLGHQLKHMVGTGGAQVDKSQLIQDDQVMAEKSIHRLGHRVVGHRFVKPVDKVMDTGEDHPVARFDRSDPQSHCYMRLSHAWGAEQNKIFPALDPVQPGQIQQCLTTHRSVIIYEFGSTKYGSREIIGLDKGGHGTVL
jgi:hypothetical protein